MITGFWYATTPLPRDLGPQEFIRHIDVRASYVSGLCWLAGKSPYQAETFQQMWNQEMAQEVFNNHIEVGAIAFPYPPTMGLIAIPLALFSWDTAKHLVDALNVIALFLIALFTYLLLKTIQPNPLILGIGIGLSLIFQLPYTTAVLIVGQNSLITTAGCLGVLYFNQRQKFFLAALFILLASIKPHLSLLLVVYLFLSNQNWRLLNWSLLTVSLSSLMVLVMGRDYTPLPELLQSMTYYKDSYANSTELLPGLYFLCGTLGINRAIINWLPVLGILIVVTLALVDRALDFSPQRKLLMVALIIGLTALFMPLHHYDYPLFFLVTSLLIVVHQNILWLSLPGLLLFGFPGPATQFLSLLIGQPITPIMVGTLASIYVTLVIVGILRFDNFRKVVKSNPQI